MAGLSSPVRTIGDNWWMLLLQGICGVIFGIVAFALPGLTLTTLVLLFAAYALLDGTAGIFAAFRTHTWAFGLFGIIGIVAGILTIINPEVTAVALLLVIAAWAILRGIFQIVTAIQLRKVLQHEWLLVLAGALSIFFGIALVLNPAVGAVAMVWLIGAYAFILGVILIALAFRFRTHAPRHLHGEPLLH